MPWRLAATVVALALSSCNFSQVGNLPNPTPSAKAATVGQPYTTDSSGVLHTNVRAGADVVFAAEGEIALAMTEFTLDRLGSTREHIERERERVLVLHELRHRTSLDRRDSLIRPLPFLPIL